MQKVLSALTLLLFLLCPTPSASMPVPTQEYISYRKLNAGQVISPFFELTAYSYFHTLFYLLSEELGHDFLSELEQLPDHIWQSLKATFVSGLPGYISLFMATLYGGWNLSGKSALLLHLTLHQFLMAVTFYQAFRFYTAEPVQFYFPGDITTDSMLLNSMFHLYFDSSNHLIISPEAWPIKPQLNKKASPVTRSLIALHQQMLSMELERCRLSPAVHQTNHLTISFICDTDSGEDDEDVFDIEGELELFTDCSPELTPPPVGSANECAISHLQPEILDCLTAALIQGSNPLHSASPCAVPRQQSFSGESMFVIALSSPQKPVNANFLISRDDQWYLTTGQYPKLDSFDSIVNQFPTSELVWPAFWSSWQKLAEPFAMMVHQLTRTTSLHTVHCAHQQFFAKHVLENIPTPSIPTVTIAESEIDYSQPAVERISPASQTQIIPSIQVITPPQSPHAQAFPMFFASNLQAMKQMRRGSFSVRYSIEPIAEYPRRGSLPLPGHAGSRRGSLSFKDAANLIINLQKTTLKPGRFVNQPEKILAHPDQGMVENHFNVIRDVSRLLMQAIFFRMINPENKDLIPLLYPSKDLSIKPKSANWNWGCGFLPENPLYSKLTATPEKIEHAREEIATLYQDAPEHVCGQQLTLTTERMEKLLSKAETIVSQEKTKVEAIFEQDGISARQTALYDKAIDRWLIHNEDGSAFNVISHPKYGPYIADYDLLMTAVPWSHFYLLPGFAQDYGLMTEEHLAIMEEGEDVLLHTEQKILAGADLADFKSDVSYHTDQGGQKTVIRKTVKLPGRYVQNQHFKPLELGNSDRLKLPMIAPWLVLDYARPKLIRFAATLGLTEPELLPLLEKATSDNYKALRHLLTKGLLQTYHPYHYTDLQIKVLSHIQPEYLPLVWQHRYPDSKPVFPKKLHQYRISSAELQAVYHARSFLLLLADLDSYLHGMDKTLGNLTPRMHQLVKQVNTGNDRGKGLAMVHHGCDSANPYSKPGDVCPATGLLPFRMGAEETVFVTGLDAIEQMISTLKGHGFYVHTNPLWKLHGKIRSSRFEWALNCFEQKEDELFHPDHDPLAREVQLTEDPAIEKELESRLGGCLAPYLYEPFIDDSDAFTHKPDAGKPFQIKTLKQNPAQNIGN